MRTIILLAILFLTSCSIRNKNYAPAHNIKSDPFVGIGLLVITIKNQDIPLFGIEKSKLPFDTVRVRGDTYGPCEFKTSTLKDNFRPYKAYDGREDALKGFHFPTGLKFRVIKENGNYYTVIIDEKSHRTALIEKNTNDVYAYSFKTWEDYIKRVACVSSFGNLTTVFDRPNGQVIDHISYSFGVSEVKGYWLKVRDATKDNHSITYWLKWRDKNKILLGLIEGVYF